MEHTESGEFVFNAGLEGHEPSQVFQPTLYIGLGGSGMKILTRLKRYFIEQYGEVPANKVFLAIDTDKELAKLDSRLDQREISLDKRTEFYHCEVVAPLTFIDSSLEAQEWIVEPFPPAAIRAGTGAVRESGRLALFAHSHDVFRRIRMAFDRLQHIQLDAEMQDQGFEQADGGIEVYVCGSVAGGTGSGTFLDVGIFCCRYLPPGTLIYAVLMGPRIYENVGAVYRTKANAYAALMELDYLMSIGQRKKKGKWADDYRVRYDRDEFVVDQPPFDVVHLVDGVNQRGKIIPTPGQLIRFISECIFLSTSANIGGVLRSAVDNVLTITTTQNPDFWNGKPAFYSSFGSAAAVYPAPVYVERGTHRFALALMDAAMSQAGSAAAAPGDPQPGDHEDVARFLSLEGIDPEASATVLDEIYPLRKIREIDEPTPIAEQLVPGYADGLASAVEEEYSGILARAAAGFADPTSAVMEKIQRYIETGGRDRDHASAGAQRATRLSLLKKELERISMAYIAGIEGAAADASSANDKARGAIERIGTAVSSGGFFTRKSTIHARVLPEHATYVDAMAAKLQAGVAQQRWEALKPAIDGAARAVDQQIGAAASGRSGDETRERIFAKARRILEGENAAVQAMSLRSGLSDFEIPVGLVEEVPPDEPALARERCGELLAHLERELGPSADDWHPQAVVQRIKAFARTYASKRFGDEVSVLELIEAHASRDPAYAERLLKNLEFLAQPLWYYDPGLINADRARQMTSVVILGAEHRQRAKDLVGDFVFGNKFQPNVVGTGDRERVTLCHFTACLPIHALADISYYEEEYAKIFVPPLHTSKQFEARCELVLPVEPEASEALKLLSVGIVPGIDLISDEHHEKNRAGRYRLLFDLTPDPQMPMLNLRPKLGDKFVRAVADLTRNRFIRDQVRQHTVAVLEEMRANEPEKLAAALDAQCAKIDAWIQERENNQMATWRYMRREVELLQRLKLWDGDIAAFFS